MGSVLAYAMYLVVFLWLMRRPIPFFCLFYVPCSFCFPDIYRSERLFSRKMSVNKGICNIHNRNYTSIPVHYHVQKLLTIIVTIHSSTQVYSSTYYYGVAKPNNTPPPRLGLT